jgi:hypothetical protein
LTLDAVKNWMRARATGLATTALALGLTLMASPVLAAGDLDSSIESGFGKLVKYGRWTAALLLGIAFVLAWAQRAQNADNPHDQSKSTKQMIWSGIGFVAVIGYKIALTGMVTWFGIDSTSIPSFLWQ